MAFDDSLPVASKYAGIYPDVLETLRRSYRERDQINCNLANGFDWENRQPNGQKLGSSDRTFKEVLDAIGEPALEAVIAVYKEMFVVPGFWTCIRSIRRIWRQPLNWGFSFNSFDRSAMEKLMQASSEFCADFPLFQADHQRNDSTPSSPCPHQCYRRIVRALGPGAHVCIVESGREDPAGGPHDVHIDFHQLGTSRIDGTHCFYQYLLDHFRDVGAHLIADTLLRDRIIPALVRIVALQASTGSTMPWPVFAARLDSIKTDDVKRKLEAEIPGLVLLLRTASPFPLAVDATIEQLVNKFLQVMKMIVATGDNPSPCGRL